ncbi:hypothetical protein CC1G_04919 [Coprinopsis cinerea okayama7|uniref:Uncharacterized protein n=1 Tax=Coprinopsis cinerea (strain Okayama-7 / 130 / ATCC MYA-4618 / FGSC 9003) TaxID=240176 RepID=A8PFJ4_COPC7|nr:hypothetical protein CC1G_04919 [Coprinopsis cinerea okayama7\|eukprot:XP_001841075.2 hypothetical protein CC1G_04919 [Coprinopsis cinerea okayama7\
MSVRHDSPCSSFLPRHYVKAEIETIQSIQRARACFNLYSSFLPPLILATQACKRELSFYTTEQLGRITKRSAKGNKSRSTRLESSSNFEVVDKLKEPLKKNIRVEPALSFLPEKRRRSSGGAQAVSAVANEDNDSDFDLVDDENDDD